MTSWLGLPQLASQHGAQLDRALGLVHVLMLVLFVGWGAFFAYVLVRFRRKRNATAAHAGVTGHASTCLPPPGESTRVRVVAEQFAWNVHYPGPDGLFGRTDPKLIDVQANPLGLDRSDPAAKDDVTTINQLHLPVDRPVLIQLTSKDVIHSFALQEMRIKQDVIPGTTIQVWFVPKVTTEEMRRRTGNPDFNYEISCAQLCGLGHYRMRGYVTVESPEGFGKWMDEQEAQLAESPEESVWR
jgi:cytochrome c oxidase subunit 2